MAVDRILLVDYVVIFQEVLMIFVIKLDLLYRIRHCFEVVKPTVILHLNIIKAVLIIIIRQLFLILYYKIFAIDFQISCGLNHSNSLKNILENVQVLIESLK